MSNIEKIKAEIERQKQMGSIGLNEYDAGFENGRGELCDELLAFIDSLPEDHFRDSTKMISKDLEEAARRYSDGPECSWVGKSALEYAFIAGAEWQKSQMPMPEDTVIFMKGVAEGRRLEREEREGYTYHAIARAALYDHSTVVWGRNKALDLINLGDPLYKRTWNMLNWIDLGVWV